MATSSGNATPGFVPELWADKMIQTLKDELIFGIKPKRSKGAQLLRDAALGHPEYPDPRVTPAENRTATEIGIRHEYANRAAQALARNIDNDILDSLRYQTYAATAARYGIRPEAVSNQQAGPVPNSGSAAGNS
jgi:hypothetical protein